MRYFCFDAETDGLYGEAFAIGTVVTDDTGKILAEFSGKCESPGVQNEWVRKNCLPHLGALPEYESRRALRDAFWAFYKAHREGALVCADVAYPVEAQLMRACVEDDLQARMFEGPYPLLDIASVLFAHGVEPHIDRQAFSGYDGPVHNPLNDATASALCLVRVMTRR